LEEGDLSAASLGQPEMKMGSKRGAAVLEAPEEESTYEVEGPSRGTGRGPGRRPSPRPFPEENDDADLYDEPAFRRQKGSYTLRVRPGLPKSWVGRAAFAAVVLAIVAVIFAGIAGLRSALLHDSRFVVDTSSDIQVSGNEHVTRAAILTVFGADLERNIFHVPLAERRADLERLPWVAHATVMRLLPNQLRVAITERTPVAFVRHGSQIGLVDASGVLLDMPADSAGDPNYSFPVLTGLSASDPLSTRAARMAIYRGFMQELDSTGEHLTKNLSEVDVSNPEDVKAVVASGGSDILVHFGDEQFLERYREFQQHLPEWKQQYPKLASADMRYERQVVLEMQPGTGVPGVGDASASVNAGAAADGSAPALVSAPRPVAAAPKAANAVPKAAVVAPKASHPKPATLSNGAKPKTANQKIFAELAAQRQAQQGKKTSHGATGAATQ
jgi:cell division protein FtsQ